jgi:hypothetical protein
MISALISLIVLIVVVGIVAYIVLLLLDMLPIEGGFKQIARVLIMLVAVLIVLMKALPLLGVSI